MMPMGLEMNRHHIEQQKSNARMKRPNCNLEEIKGRHGDLQWKGRRALHRYLTAFVVWVYARKHPCAVPDRAPRGRELEGG